MTEVDLQTAVSKMETQALRDSPYRLAIVKEGRSVLLQSDHQSDISQVERIFSIWNTARYPDNTQPWDWRVVSSQISSEARLPLIDFDCSGSGGWSEVALYGNFRGRSMEVIGRQLVQREKESSLTIVNESQRTTYQMWRGTEHSATHLEHLLKYPFRVFLRELGYFPLHAAAVNYRGKGIVMLGDKGAGKTTLSSLMIQAGAKYVGNDVVYVGVNPADGNARMLAWPHPIGYAKGTVNEVPWLREAIQGLSGDLAEVAPGESKVRVNCGFLHTALGKGSVLAESPLHCIVLPEIDLSLPTAQLYAPSHSRVVTLINEAPGFRWLTSLDGLIDTSQDRLLRNEAAIDQRLPTIGIRFGKRSSRPAEAIDEFIRDLDVRVS